MCPLQYVVSAQSLLRLTSVLKAARHPPGCTGFESLTWHLFTFKELVMLYQINYNRGYNTPVCATEYVHADSTDEAWVKGDCMAQYPEQVSGVFVIRDTVH